MLLLLSNLWWKIRELVKQEEQDVVGVSPIVAWRPNDIGRDNAAEDITRGSELG